MSNNDEEKKNKRMPHKRRKPQPEGIFTRGLVGFFEADPGVISPFVLFV